MGVGDLREAEGAPGAGRGVAALKLKLMLCAGNGRLKFCDQGISSFLSGAWIATKGALKLLLLDDLAKAFRDDDADNPSAVALPA